MKNARSINYKPKSNEDWFIIPGLWKVMPADGKLVNLRNKSDANNLKLKIDNGKLLIIEDEEEEETEEEWTIPQENTKGHIVHSSGQVLCIDSTDETKILLQPLNYSHGSDDSKDSDEYDSTDSDLYDEKKIL